MTTKFFAIAAAALLIGSAIPAQAENNTTTPGHKMQTKGSVKGQPGASGYAPGHVMQQKGSRKGFPGASGYAPGHSTTTGSSSDRR
jgi:hypothetical protein